MDQRDYYGTAGRRRRFWPFLLLSIVTFLCGIGAAALALGHWPSLDKLIHPVSSAQPVVSTPQPAPRPAMVTAPAAPPSEAALDERVATIESRLDQIDARAAAASGDADRAEGLLIAFAARRALDRGQPLGYLEGMLRERFGNSDATSVAQIIAASQRPVTLPQLQDELQALKATLVTHDPDEGLWQGFKHELASLFVVRRADQPSTIPADRFSRAEHALEQGQVDAAATEVARMPGRARALDWLAQARRYVMARNALDRIETAALLKPPATPAPLALPTH
jgi:ABC-type amino acid transport substrate-binding protein